MWRVAQAYFGANRTNVINPTNPVLTMPAIKKTTPRNFGKMMGLLTKLNLQGRRHAIVWDYSRGRTESSKELSYTEINAIIKALEAGFTELGRCDIMRKKIISMAREMGWEVYSQQRQKTVADMERIEAWCIKFGYLHKGLNKYTYTELPKLVTQFEAMYTGFLNDILK